MERRPYNCTMSPVEGTSEGHRGRETERAVSNDDLVSSKGPPLTRQMPGTFFQPGLSIATRRYLPSTPQWTQGRLGLRSAQERPLATTRRSRSHALDRRNGVVFGRATRDAALTASAPADRKPNRARVQGERQRAERTMRTAALNVTSGLGQLRSRPPPFLGRSMRGKQHIQETTPRMSFDVVSITKVPSTLKGRHYDTKPWFAFIIIVLLVCSAPTNACTFPQINGTCGAWSCPYQGADCYCSMCDSDPTTSECCSTESGTCKLNDGSDLYVPTCSAPDGGGGSGDGGGGPDNDVDCGFSAEYGRPCW